MCHVIRSCAQGTDVVCVCVCVCVAIDLIAEYGLEFVLDATHTLTAPYTGAWLSLVNVCRSTGL